MIGIRIAIVAILSLLLLGPACRSQSTLVDFSSTGPLLQPGWSLISLPGTPSDPRPETVLAGTSFPNDSLQYWDNQQNGGEYRSYGLDWFGPMEPGVSYWINETPPAKDIHFAGSENLNDWVINLPDHGGASAWFMFGHPFSYPTPCSAVRFSTPTRPEPMDWMTAAELGVVEYNGATFDSSTHSSVIVGIQGDRTSFEPWAGYWLLVSASEPVTVTIPAVRPQMASVRFTGGAALFDPETNRTVGIPEAPAQWQADGTNEPAAYVMGAPASIEGSITASGPAGCQARIRAVEGSLVGESAPGWPFRIEMDSPKPQVSAQTPNLPAVLAQHTLELRWYTEISYDGQSWYPIQTPLVTRHTVFTLLGTPNPPMDYNPAAGPKHQGAWIPLVEAACKWGATPQQDGSRVPATNTSSALANLTAWINHGDFFVKVPSSNPPRELATRSLFHYVGTWETDFAQQDLGVFPPYADGEPLFDDGNETGAFIPEEGEGSWQLVEGTSEDPAYSGSRFYRVTGTEVRNAEAWDYSLAEYPYLGWTWKKDGGTTCELRIRVRNNANGETCWLRYWQGSQPSPCDDPSLRVDLWDEIPTDWFTIFRDVQEDVAHLLGWPREQIHLIGMALRPGDGVSASYDSILLGAGSHRLRFRLASYMASAAKPSEIPGGRPEYFHYQLRGECDDVAQLQFCLGASVGMNLAIAQLSSASGSGFWQQDICPIGWDSCVDQNLGPQMHPGWNHGEWVVDSLWPMPWGTFYRTLWHQVIYSLEDNRVYDATFSMRDPANPQAHRYPASLPFLDGSPDDYRGWLDRPGFYPPPGVVEASPAWLFQYSLSPLELE